MAEKNNKKDTSKKKATAKKETTKATKTAVKTAKATKSATASKAASESPAKTEKKKPANRFGLGAGLDTLIPPVTVAEETVPVKIKEEKVDNVISTGETLININKIEPNPNQPRKKFDEDALAELAESIKIHGLIQPIIVQKKKDMYQIVAGERRWRACRLAKIKEIPVIIKDISETERYELALIENIQREDLNDIEEAYAYKALIDEFDLKQDEVAERVSKSRVAVTNSLRLLRLDTNVQELVVNGLISGGHARALLGINDGVLQYDTAMRIIDEKLSVRETEKLVKQILNRNDKPRYKKAVDNEAVYRQYEDNLRAILGSKVEIKQNGQNKGKIVIEFNSTDEFERVFDIIKR